MPISRVASRHTYKAFGAGDLTLTVAGGSPIHVYGMIFTPGAADTTYTITDVDDDTLQVIEIPSGTAGNLTSMELSCGWVADNGVKVVSSETDAHVTVFHNSPGN